VLKLAAEREVENELTNRNPVRTSMMEAVGSKDMGKVDGLAPATPSWTGFKAPIASDKTVVRPIVRGYEPEATGDAMDTLHTPRRGWSEDEYKPHGLRKRSIRGL
jgi:hypothetical protein